MNSESDPITESVSTFLPKELRNQWVILPKVLIRYLFVSGLLFGGAVVGIVFGVILKDDYLLVSGFGLLGLAYAFGQLVIGRVEKKKEIEMAVVISANRG